MANIADLEYLRRQWANKQANRASGTQVLNQGTDIIGDAVDNSPNVFVDYQNTLARHRQAQEQSRWENYQRQAEIAQQKAEENKSWWQKLMDWGAGAMQQFGEGFLNVADNFWDAAMFFVGGISGGWWGQENAVTKWTQEAAEYDWQAPVSNVLRKYTGLNVLNPEIYKSEYWTSGFGSPEEARANLARQNRFTDNETWQSIHDRGWNIAGELLGEIALTKGIGSAVKGGKAAQLVAKGIQAGVGSAGASFESASKEGASFQEASRYAALKGTVSGVTSAALYSVGAQGYGPYAQGSTKFGSFVFDKTSSGGLAKFVDILQRAGGNAMMSAAQTAADPFLKQITYNANAIDEAYGSDEARAKTFGNIAVSAATSFATSALMQGIPEAYKRVKLGKEGYSLDYALKDIRQTQQKASDLMDKAAKAKNLETAQKYMKEAQILMEKANRYNEDIEQMSKDAIWEDGKFKGFKEGSKYANQFKNTEALGDTIKQGSKTLSDNIRLFKKSRAVALYRYHIQGDRPSNPRFSEDAYSFSDPKEDGSFTATSKDTGRRYSIALADDVAYYAPKNIERGIDSIVSASDLPTDVLGVKQDDVVLLLPKPVIENAIDENINAKEISSAIAKADLSKLDFGKFTFEVKKSADGKLITVTDIQPKSEAPNVEIVSPTANEVENAPKPRDNDYQIPREYIADSAKANNVKVYAYQRTLDTLRDIKDDLTAVFGIDNESAKITFENKSMTKSADDLFRILNKKNASSEEVSTAVMKMFDSVEIKFKGGGVLFGDEIKKPEFQAIKDTIDLSVKEHLKDLLLSGEDSLPTKIQSLKAVFAETKKALLARAKEFKDRIQPVKVMKGLRKSVPAGLKRDVDLTDVDTSAQMGSFLARPLINLKSIDGGYSATYLSDGKTKAKTALLEIFSKYTEDAYDPEKGNVPLFPYDQSLKDEMDKLISMWPDDTDGKNHPLPSNALKQANKVIRMIYSLHKQAKENFIRVVKPSAMKGLERVKETTQSKAVKYFANNAYTRNFSSRWAIVRAYLGGTKLEQDMTVKMEQLSAKAEGHVKTLISDEIKPALEKTGAKKLLGKKYEVNGVTLYSEDLIDLYATLKSSNFDDSDNNGMVYEQEVSHPMSKSTYRYIPLTKSGEAQKTLDWLEGNMPKELKDFADWLRQDYFNTSAREFELETARQLGRHDTTLIENYYPRNASNIRPTKVTSVVKAPKTFPHEKERVRHNNPFVVRSAISRALSFASDQARLRYLYPQYERNMYALGAKDDGGNSIYKTLANHDQRVAKIILDSQNAFMGVGTDGIISDPFAGKRASALLSYNPGTPPKQTVSLLNANFSMPTVVKGLARRFFGSEQFKTEYKKLKTDIDEVRFRNQNKAKLDVVYDGLGSKLSYAINKTIDAGMWGTLFADEKTIDMGLAVSMSFAYDQGNEIGSNAFNEAVRDYLADFILMQIGNSPLTASNASSGNAGPTLRFLTFMNGAQRAALSAMEDKFFTASRAAKLEGIDLDKRVKDTEWGLNQALYQLGDAEKVEADYQDRLAKAKEDESLKGEERKKAIDELKDRLEQATLEREEAEIRLSEATAEAEQAKADKRTQARFKAQGGKNWWLSSIVALAVSGAMTAFFSDIARKIRGTREWTDWSIANFGKDAGLYAAFGWLPVASTITNALEGYDTTIPSGYVLSTMSSLMSSAVDMVKSGFTDQAKTKEFIRSSIEAVSIFTGLPMSNVYRLAYGTVKVFSPETADQMKSIFYVNAVNNAKIIDAIESGNDKMALYYMNKMAEENCGALSEAAQKEFLKLYKDGNSPVASAIPTRYTNAKGQEVIITWTQQQNAKRHYSRANATVNRAILSGIYRKLASAQRASLIRSIYTAYRQAALSQAVPNYDASLGKMALLAKIGTSTVSDIFVAVSAIRGLDATEKKTKKQLAIEYVNKLKVSKDERLLILYIAGYTVDEKSVTKALKAKGMSDKDVKSFMGLGEN